MRGFNRGVDRRLALSFEVTRELDDQDSVLRGQPDRGQQTHLEVHVVFQVERRRRCDGTENSEWHHHDH